MYPEIDLETLDDTENLTQAKPPKFICRYPKKSPRASSSIDPDAIESSDDDDADKLSFLTHSLKDVNIGYHFFGKSSEVHLVKATLDLKMEYAGEDVAKEFKILKPIKGKPGFFLLHPVSEHHLPNELSS